MKFERAPLHESGFKEITIYQLDACFLEPFKNQERRLYLIGKFKAFIAEFNSLGISAEVWIDGSFTTTDEDPQDIDMVFLLKQSEVDSLSLGKKVIFQQLLVDHEKVKIAYNCDVYFIDAEEVDARNYYTKLFRMERNGLNEKGIFKLVLKR